MIRGEKKAISLIAVLTALFFVAATVCGVNEAWASEQSIPRHDGASPVKLWITEGKVTGSFKNRPLFESLDAIGGETGFEYRGDKDLLNRPVSGTFEEAPLIDAVKTILEPFNYVIIFRANGEIKRLHITSLRRGSGGAVAPAAGVPAQRARPDAGLATALPGVELTEEQRLLFEMAYDKLDLPPELLEYFEPVPEPGSAKTGPRIPPDMALQDLPEFEPLVSETGPFDPNAMIQDLPEFEPFAADTGPSPDTPQSNETHP